MELSKYSMYKLGLLFVMIFETRLINETRLLFECNKVLGLKKLRLINEAGIYSMPLFEYTIDVAWLMNYKLVAEWVSYVMASGIRHLEHVE